VDLLANMPYVLCSQVNDAPDPILIDKPFPVSYSRLVYSNQQLHELGNGRDTYLVARLGTAASSSIGFVLSVLPRLGRVLLTSFLKLD
jgi:hypothetical protein